MIAGNRHPENRRLGSGRRRCLRSRRRVCRPAPGRGAGREAGRRRLCRTRRDRCAARDRLRHVQHAGSAMMDLLWSTGELRAVALLALALQSRGVRATGINVHQTGLTQPDGAGAPGHARFRPLRIFAELASHAVVVVPGFLARGAGDAVLSLGAAVRSDSRAPGRRPPRQPVRAHQGCRGILLGGSQSPSGRAPGSGHHLLRCAGDGRRWMRARPARGAEGGATALGSSSRAFD